MFTKLIAALLTGALFISMSSTAGAIYTWEDKNGVTHYSQQPPAGVDARKVYSEDIERDKVGYVAPMKKSAAVSEESDLAKSAKLINEQDSKQAESLCENAKHSSNMLKSFTHLTKKDEKTGESVAMTEEAKQKALKENEERVKLFCK